MLTLTIAGAKKRCNPREGRRGQFVTAGDASAGAIGRLRHRRYGYRKVLGCGRLAPPQAGGRPLRLPRGHFLNARVEVRSVPGLLEAVRAQLALGLRDELPGGPQGAASPVLDRLPQLGAANTWRPPGGSLRYALDAEESRRWLVLGDALSAIRHFLATKKVSMDLIVQFDDPMRLTALTLTSTGTTTRKGARGRARDGTSRMPLAPPSLRTANSATWCSSASQTRPR